jgi:hypothetical protein
MEEEKLCVHCLVGSLEKIETYLYTHAIDNVYEYYRVYKCSHCQTLFEEAVSYPWKLYKFPKFVK